MCVGKNWSEIQELVESKLHCGWREHIVSKCDNTPTSKLGDNKICTIGKFAHMWQNSMSQIEDNVS